MDQPTHHNTALRTAPLNAPPAADIQTAIPAIVNCIAKDLPTPNPSQQPDLWNQSPLCTGTYGTPPACLACAARGRIGLHREWARKRVVGGYLGNTSREILEHRRSRLLDMLIRRVGFVVVG